MVRNGCPGCTGRLRCLTVLTPQIKKKGRAPAGAPAADMFPVARRKPAAKGAAKPRSSASRVGSGVINRPTPMIRQPDDSSDTDREDVVDLDGFLRDLVAVVEESGAGVGQPEPAVAGQPSEAGRDVESLGELRVAIGAQGSEDESSDSSDGGHRSSARCAILDRSSSTSIAGSAASTGAAASTACREESPPQEDHQATAFDEGIPRNSFWSMEDRPHLRNIQCGDRREAARGVGRHVRPAQGPDEQTALQKSHQDHG